MQLPPVPCTSKTSSDRTMHACICSFLIKLHTVTKTKVSPPFTTAFELSVCPFVALHHKRPNSPPPSLHNVWCVIPPLKTTVHKIFVQRTGPVCPKSCIFHPFLNHFESTTLLHAGPEQKPRQIYIY